MKYLIPAIALAAAFFLGIFAHEIYEREAGIIEVSQPEKDLHLGMNEFINPLLDCQSADVTPPKENRMKEEIEEYVAKAKQNGRVQFVSVYYRDLFNGPSFGIETEEHFTPASLLKVPVLIAYFKELEKSPRLLDEKVTYDPKKHNVESTSQVVDVPPPLISGKSYTVDFLLNRMITLSDNVSAKMLVDYRPDLDIGKTLLDMGIQVHPKKEGGTWIDVRSYAGLMRILYNSTYLSRTYSNAALSILAKSEFKDGLVAGVEPGIPVAHKFGERTLDKIVQMHDCGIVYFPGRPYLTCIMTRGKSFKELIPTVAEISKIIYKQVKMGNK